MEDMATRRLVAARRLGYGNYIDEPALMSESFISWTALRHLVLDHLYTIRGWP